MTGQITPINALKAINIDVILFLLGMFIIGEALERSGYLSYLSSKLFKRTRNVNILILIIIFSAGILAALLMNDTIAIIGTPVVLMLAFRNSINPKLLLLTLAFAVTIGTVMSPIGNPQNLLIALNENMPNPFITFIEYLFIPTIINLCILYITLKFFYKKEFTKKIIYDPNISIKDEHLAKLSRYSLYIVAILILAKITVVFLKIPFDFKLTYIALIAALPIIIFSNKRFIVIKNIDWYTLIFFTTMFILMQSVWDCGFFQKLIETSGINLLSITMIFTVSILLSQFISNVPLVALYLPILTTLHATSKELVALAAASTIAGNLLILGAASNIIIIQNAEKRKSYNNILGNSPK